MVFIITLKKVLKQKGYDYETVFSKRAEDIEFDKVENLCFSLGYILRNVKKIDAEIPIDSTVLDKITPNFPITSGSTTGGHKKKWAPEYRIYFKTIYQIPLELKKRLQDDNQMRITGSLFIESCMHIGFKHGNIQNEDLIIGVIKKIFNTNEQKSFFEGYMKVKGEIVV